MYITSIYLDNAATTPLSQKVKERLISLLYNFYNPSSAYQSGQEVGKIISDAREAVAKFINADSKNIYFTPSGSGSNTLAIKGMTSENPEENFVQLPIGSTQWGDGFTEDDYRALVKSLYSGEVKVSNDITAMPSTSVKVTDYGSVK